MAKKAKDSKLIMRIDSALKERARVMADSHELSLSQYVEKLIIRDLGPAAKDALKARLGREK